MARVDIPRARTGEHYVLVFEGLSGGQASSIAIDDIVITQGACIRPVETPGRQRKLVLHSDLVSMKRLSLCCHNGFIEDLTCDFRRQQICRWQQVDVNWSEFGVQLTDDLDWVIQGGPTPGTETGPSADHTSGSGKIQNSSFYPQHILVFVSYENMV